MMMLLNCHGGVNRAMAGVLPLLLVMMTSAVTAELCDVSTGQPAIILDLPESLGQETDQLTSPQELPFNGAPDAEVSVTLSSEGTEYFNLTGKTLRLLKPLDRDEEDLTTIRFTAQCRVLSTGVQRSVPVVVRLIDINDNAPQFVGGPYQVTVPESTAVGSTIFSSIKAEDADAGANGQVRYSVVPGKGGPTDGYGVLSIPLPHFGHVTVANPLDYEKSNVLVLNIQASDISSSDRQTSITTLTVVLEDSDDQDPVFQPCPTLPCLTPEYSSTVVADHRVGVMDIMPYRIHAIDLDSLGASVRYSFESGTPSNFRQFFSIDQLSGAVSQIASVPRGLTSTFKLIVKAEEQTPRRGSIAAPLTITVENPDSAMPIVKASRYIGTVKENSVPGTPVLDQQGLPITLTVTDPDLLPDEALPQYKFELTTGAFTITPEDGLLRVAQTGLDRDPPSLPTHTFQVVAREVPSNGSPRGASAASTPITITVRLLDTNDHSPRFPVYPPVVVPAGEQNVLLRKVKAHDPDEGLNGTVEYELAGVVGSSTAGPVKFMVEPESGDVRLIGEVTAGEAYKLTIKATDGGGRSGSIVLDVTVDRGPNTGGPYFPRREFSTIVPEDAAPGSTVIRLKAVDPDGDVPRYSLHPIAAATEHPPVEDLPFQVDPLSGEVTLSRAVDRETLDRYSMIITAEDDEGLRGSVTLDVIIADVNDEAPQFKGLPYSFRVDEGREGVLLGVVKATDNDQDRSGLVEYSVPEDSPLSVGPYNGTVYTRVALDFEKQQVHYVPLIAVDGGRPPLSSTTTLTLLVGDVSDEPPMFSQDTYEVTISEAAQIGALVATVTASDPDSTPSVKYVMRSVGKESRLFSVHPDTGRVTVTGAIDRELAEEYVLVIGTQENQGYDKGSTCTVIVTVLDENDSTPVLQPLPPVLVTLSTPVGAVIAVARASDDDATSPNNKINFEFRAEDETVSGHISIDSQSGALTLQKKFTDVNITEYKAEVVARDGGTPPRSTSTPLMVLVEVPGRPTPRIAAVPSFSRSKVFITIKEDTPVGKMIARIGIINPPADPICELKEDSGHYEAVLTDSGDCGVMLKSPLDADLSSDATQDRLVLQLRDPETVYNVTAEVKLNVEDVNDNAPQFVLAGVSRRPQLQELSEPSSEDVVPSTVVLSNDTVMVALSMDTPAGTVLTRLNATDLDSGTNGALRYSLLPKSNRLGYFSMDGATGTLVAARDLRDVPSDLNPFNLTVVVEDAPMESRHNSDSLNVMVAVITADHRLVLPVRALPEAVRAKTSDIQAALAERTDGGMIVLERVASDRRRAGTAEVWLAMIDTNTGSLMSKTQPAVNRVMSQASDDPSSLRYQLLRAIGEDTLLEPVVEEKAVNTVRHHRPYSPPDEVFGGTSLSGGGPESIIASVPGLQLGLVILAVVILILGLVSILYICIQWARAVREREKPTHFPIMRVPILAHPAPSSITDTLHKQYEVQVLHMSVPVDDDSVKDVTPQRSAHNFFMDNVSYISKNIHTHDDSHSSAGGPHDVGPTPPWAALPSTSGFSPNSKPFDSDSDDDHRYSHSATNHNVMFGRRGQAVDRSGHASGHNDGYGGARSGHPGGHHDSYVGARPGHAGGFNDSYVGVRPGHGGAPNDGYDDDSVIGYGFEGAGLGTPITPITELAPVQTATPL